MLSMLLINWIVYTIQCKVFCGLCVFVDDVTAAYTPGDDSYNHVWVTTAEVYIRFRVKAAKSAKIALSTMPFVVSLL